MSSTIRTVRGSGGGGGSGVAGGSGAAGGSGSGAAGGTGFSGPSIQNSLTEEAFQKRLDGYSLVEPHDLVDGQGGRLRYAIDEFRPDGSIRNTKYRLGGIIVAVDPQLRYARVMNAQIRSTWSVQLQPKMNERIRLYFMPAGTTDEIITMRKLMEQLDRGELRINKVSK
jgi:hypothetical protein